ncbi:sugar transporter SWEET1 isoform X1 [Hylaeus anthracinus]|uniref:sugar transporter SWEET1 isoform X1 n=1 Tax=Hylaeus anthracinus TaxID=313031 RepID=UPI0023B9E989|nr:sugar transporter SWEET1 isoform X1 [Hylaeus anthracinus]
MVSTEIKDSLAFTASVCTVLQFLAGVLVCRKIIKSGTTGSSSALAFVTCYTSCVLWMRYGTLIGDRFILVVNVFGTILQASYICVFVLYSVQKSKTVKQAIAATLFLGAVYFYSFYEEDRALAAKYVGLLSCTVTVLFFASPLMMLAHVIRVKSTESLPFPIIVASLIVSSQWFTYGCLLNDRFIQIPNFLGCVLSAFQLCFFLIYRSDRISEAHLI